MVNENDIKRIRWLYEEKLKEMVEPQEIENVRDDPAFMFQFMYSNFMTLIEEINKLTDRLKVLENRMNH